LLYSLVGLERLSQTSLIPMLLLLFFLFSWYLSFLFLSF